MQKRDQSSFFDPCLKSVPNSLKHPEIKKIKEKKKWGEKNMAAKKNLKKSLKVA